MKIRKRAFSLISLLGVTFLVYCCSLTYQDEVVLAKELPIGMHVKNQQQIKLDDLAESLIEGGKKALYGTDGIMRNYEIAYELFAQAEHLGSTGTYYYLGLMYDEGYYVEEDNVQAYFWYEKSANEGYATSMNKLGMLYYKGEGVAADYAKAMEYYEMAVAKGNTSAMNNIGMMYHSGIGVVQSYETAMEWFVKAAEAGNASAMYNVACYYYYGFGVNKDTEQALSWAKKALAEGYTAAQDLIQVCE